MGTEKWGYQSNAIFEKANYRNPSQDFNPDALGLTQWRNTYGAWEYITPKRESRVEEKGGRSNDHPTEAKRTSQHKEKD